MSVGVSEADDFALLGHRDAATRAAAAKSLAKRRRLSPALAVFLRADRDVKVRVAAERSLTRTLEGHEVARLLRSDEPEERVLGADAVLDIGTLTALARDPSPLVREVVAQGSPPVDLLMALAHDSSDDVRLAVARDFRSAREVYEILERDQTERVREEALRRRNWRLEHNDDIAAALGLNLHRILSGESGSARGALTVMISAPHTSLRVRLARQPWIPAETLAQWAHDVEPAVVEAVAGNPSTPVSVLALIMESRWGPDPRIAMANVAMRADVRETAWRFPQGIFRDDVLDLPSELLEVIGTNP
ncbi:hypothetical protein GCM10025873_26870 [Demequina sediminis]|nr:hypothetical protein [Demequina sediminis]BDZ62896.1 hypothetical protein GCM10025873_26870 [Demequina sediminis]